MECKFIILKSKTKSQRHPKESHQTKDSNNRHSLARRGECSCGFEVPVTAPGASVWTVLGRCCMYVAVPRFMSLCLESPVWADLYSRMMSPLCRCCVSLLQRSVVCAYCLSGVIGPTIGGLFPHFKVWSCIYLCKHTLSVCERLHAKMAMSLNPFCDDSG